MRLKAIAGSERPDHPAARQPSGAAPPAHKATKVAKTKGGASA
jgi:hypothetical protein